MDGSQRHSRPASNGLRIGGTAHRSLHVARWRTQRTVSAANGAQVEGQRPRASPPDVGRSAGLHAPVLLTDPRNASSGVQADVPHSDGPGAPRVVARWPAARPPSRRSPQFQPAATRRTTGARSDSRSAYPPDDSPYRLLDICPIVQSIGCCAADHASRSRQSVRTRTPPHPVPRAQYHRDGIGR